MKKQDMTATALAQFLNEAGISTGKIHATQASNFHYIQIKSIDDVEKALKVAEEKGFLDVKQAGKKGRISLPNPTLKTVRKKAQSKKVAKKTTKKAAPKKAAAKATAKPASKKTAAKFKGKVGPKKKIPAMFIEGKVILALLEGVTIYNLELILIAFLKKKDPGVRKSILKKVVQATGVQIEGGLTADIQKKLEKLERIEKAVGSRKK